MKLFLLIAFGVATASPEESGVLQNFVAGNVGYIGKLYKELVKSNPGNFLVSPISVQIIFALINGGARGNTARQITDSLHLPEGEANIRETFRPLTGNLQISDQYSLSCANKIYLANNFNINNSFKRTAVDVFRSEIDHVDFGNAYQAAAEINRWVEQNTHNKIHDLISPDSLSSATVAVMINALYFQGEWVKEFVTLPAFFYTGKNKRAQTDMITITDNFNFYKSKELGATFLEVPYKGDDITMSFVLPDEVDGLSSLEARIDEAIVAPKYRMDHLEVVIPKFRIESTIPFIPILQTLGITDAFEGRADFTGFGENRDPLYISDVIQKTFIEVDEKGTTAAAATEVSFDRVLGPDLRFVADHPFIFYLKHKVDGIFFIGRFTTPEEVH